MSKTNRVNIWPPFKRQGTTIKTRIANDDVELDGNLTIGGELDAPDMKLDTSNFDNNLSAADDTVQKAMDTLDEMTASGAENLGELTDVDGPLSYTDGYVLRADGDSYAEVQLSHDDLTDIGTTSHADIDLHIADTSNPHSVTAVQAGAIPDTYLDTDPALSANSDEKVGSQKAIKTYVDTFSSGIVVKMACKVATTEALPACTYDNGTLGVGATLTADADGALPAIDDIILEVGDRILVKDQAAGLQNGIYTVTATGGESDEFVLTRATDYDTDAEIVAGTTTFIIEGTDNQNYDYAQIADTPTIGTDALVFTQKNKTSAYTASLGVKLDGADFQADILANEGLALDGDSMKVDYDGTSLGIVDNKLAILADGVLNANIGEAVATDKGGTGLSALGNSNEVLGVDDAGTGYEFKAIVGLDNITVTHTAGQIGISAAGGGSGASDYTISQIPFTVYTAVVWTNMPAALTELYGSTAYRRTADLTGAAQYRLTAVQTVAGAVGADFNVQYSLNNGSTWAALNLNAGEGEMDANTTGNKNGAWVDIAVAAKSSVLLRVVGKDGDGALDPSFRNIMLEIKYNSTLVEGADGGDVYTERTIHSHATSALAFTNLPAAVGELTSSRSRFYFDATHSTDYRIVITQAVAGYAGSDLNLQYSPNAGSTWYAADTAGAGEVDCGTGTGIKKGAWATLVAGAKGDYIWRIVGKGGDGIVDPSFYQLAVQFKQAAGATPAGDTGDVQINIDGALGVVPDGGFQYDFEKGDLYLTGGMEIGNGLAVAVTDETKYTVASSAFTYSGTDYKEVMLDGEEFDDGIYFLENLESGGGGPQGLVAIPLSDETGSTDSIDGTQDVGVQILELFIPGPNVTMHSTVYFPATLFADEAASIAFWEALVGAGNVTSVYFSKAVFANDGAGNDYTFANPDDLVKVTGFEDANIVFGASALLLENDSLNGNPALVAPYFYAGMLATGQEDGVYRFPTEYGDPGQVLAMPSAVQWEVSVTLLTIGGIDYNDMPLIFTTGPLSNIQVVTEGQTTVTGASIGVDDFDWATGTITGGEYDGNKITVLFSTTGFTVKENLESYLTTQLSATSVSLSNFFTSGNVNWDGDKDEYSWSLPGVGSYAPGSDPSDSGYLQLAQPELEFVDQSGGDSFWEDAGLSEGDIRYLGGDVYVQSIRGNVGLTNFIIQPADGTELAPSPANLIFRSGLYSGGGEMGFMGWEFGTGSNYWLKATNPGNVIFNDSNSSNYFQVKGSETDNLFYVDEANERVGIGSVGAADTALDVRLGTSNLVLTSVDQDTEMESALKLRYASNNWYGGFFGMGGAYSIWGSNGEIVMGARGFSTYGDPTDHMVAIMDNDLNFGIGTDQPTGKFQVGPYLGSISSGGGAAGFNEFTYTGMYNGTTVKDFRVQIDQAYDFRSPAYLTGGGNAEDDYTVWANVTDGWFNYTINGLVNGVGPLNFSEVTSMDNVASVIQAGIRAADVNHSTTCVWDADHFTISSDVLDGTSSITVLSNHNSGTEISGPTWMDADATNGVVTPVDLDLQTFEWSNDGGDTWEATGVEATGDWQSLEDDVRIKFYDITTRTVGNYWDFTGYPVAMTITGNDVEIGGDLSTGDILPKTDDTYYIGKNDDDGPLAYKGIILKDTTNGKYYRVEVISGVVTATDLTD